MTTIEDNKQEEVTTSTPQEKPRDTSIAPSGAAQQAERDIPAAQADQPKQPTPPRVPGTPVKTRVLPERQAAEIPLRADQSPGQAAPIDPAAGLADMNWMPPAEDQVARFLNDVADIAPPPTREREARVPNFMLPASASPEAVKRKKAKTEPFWSQVVATPMEHPTLSSESPDERRHRRSRSRLPLRWLIVASVIVLLVIGALVVLVLTHHLLLPKGVHL